MKKGKVKASRKAPAKKDKGREIWIWDFNGNGFGYGWENEEIARAGMSPTSRSKLYTGYLREVPAPQRGRAKG